MLTDIMNDHGLEQLVHFPTREKNTLDLSLTSLPGQFQDICRNQTGKAGTKTLKIQKKL